MEQYARLFQEIVEREQARNLLLLDSEFANFALSEESLMEEALRAFDMALTKSLAKQIEAIE